MCRGVGPTYQVTGTGAMFGAKMKFKRGVSVESLLDLAPEKQNNQVKVPQVL